MMYTYIDENGSRTRARNYHEAAVNLYGMTYYHNPATEGTEADLCTLYVRRTRPVQVDVFKVGDKQGTYWGVQAAHPQHHILRREA